MRSIPDDTIPDDTAAAARTEAIDRHPTALGRHLDTYLAAVARELQIRGVITGEPQRTDPAQRLLGSIVVDTAGLRAAGSTRPIPPSPAAYVNAVALHADRPAPVIVTWDENAGWCVGLHHDSIESSRRYLHPDLLPSADVVAEFVVALALGQPVGATHPITIPTPGRPRLRLIR